MLFILVGSTVFSFTFNAADGHIWVEHLFDDMPGGAMGFLIVVNILVFILGCFIDFFEIAFIVIPILAPVADKILPGLLPPGTPADMTLIWFGVIIAMNLQTSFLTPPFGFALFYLRSVAAKNDYKDRRHRRADPGGADEPDLQGLDRLHLRAAGDGGGADRLPGAGDRRHREDGARSTPTRRCRSMQDKSNADRDSASGAAAAVPAAPRRRRPQPAPRRQREGRPDEGPARIDEEGPGQEALIQAGAPAPTHETTNPAEAGLFLCRRGAPARAGAGQSFCDCMKSSKRFSVKRNHRFWSRRKFE